ncbi:hypothetical protein IEE94_03525 [Yimella sp. cx-573]|nr:hypothetical protein [Yimella sp. cx-573]
MSQATAARPLPVRRAPRGTNPTAARPRLKLVQPQTQAASGGSLGFVALCVTLVVGGLLTVLLLNTARAQQQYTIGDLQAASSRLAGTSQDLDSQLDSVRAPQQLALKAQEYGLVPASSIRYVRQSDHRLLGVANGTASGAPFTVGTLPKTAASSVAGLAVTTADKSITIKEPEPKVAESPQPSSPSPAASTKASPSAKPSPSSPAAPTSSSSPKGAEKKTTTDQKTTPAQPTSAR